MSRCDHGSAECSKSVVVVSQSIFDRVQVIQQISTTCEDLIVVHSPGGLDDLMARCGKFDYFDCCVLVLESSVLLKDPAVQTGDLLRKGQSLRVLAWVETDEVPILKRLAMLGCFGFLTDHTSLPWLQRMLYAAISGEMWFPRMLLSGLLQALLIEQNYNGLSRREGEILTLLGQELSNKRIAERLFISQETLRWHLRNLYAKARVHGRDNLIIYANGFSQTGLVEAQRDAASKTQLEKTAVSIT